VVLRGDRLPHGVPGQYAHALEFAVEPGEVLGWTLQWQADADMVPPPLDVAKELVDSVEFWHGWPGGLNYLGPHAAAVRRSLITLKGLTYAPTGGIVAAPTTSLPEELGGQRNWDYRYCWLRDAALTILAFDNFDCRQEAAAWRRWLLRAVAGDPGDVQIMYGINGARHLVEWEADWLPGYQGAKPVRIGNAAYGQLQLDVYGEVMDALHVSRECGITETGDGWRLQLGLMSHLEQIWQQPDKGIWEVRGPDRQFTHSRVMVWTAFDRAVRAVEEFGLAGPVDRWRELREAVHAEVLERGWNAEIGAFTQCYGGTDLDAATLLIPQVGFLPGDDERVRATVDAIGASLKHGDLVDRYTTDAGESAVDGLDGHEGAFLACSFWYADAMSLCGRQDEAVAMFERLVALSNDVGLLAEEYDADTGRFTGNFPQAFSHLALVNTAAQLFHRGARARHHRRGPHPHHHRIRR
jgi:glucoamylase